MKNLSLLLTISFFIFSCSKSTRGELTGIEPKKFFPTQPLGMLLIPSGSFLMGMADDDYVKLENAPVSTVSIKAFYMDETEITNGEYKQFVFWVRDSIVRDALAKRAIQELSYDTFKSSKSMEVEVTPSLRVPLPHDYVNYIKVCYIDNDGIERILYPARKTGNPISYAQDANGDYLFQADSSLLYISDSTQWTRYQGANEDESGLNDPKRSDDDFESVQGRRFGLEPEHAQFNGIFYIDEHRGYINLSSSMSGKILVLKYISDGLGTDDEMIVHKFAEEAVYKCIAHAILATKMNTPEYLVARYKKERRAALRTAKLRLSNYKSEELQQTMRGKSKQIKH